MITPEEIARLRELEKKATPGPWKLKMEKIDMGRKEFPMIIGGFHVVCTIGAFEWDSNKDERDANTKLITVFRNALPNLLDEIERQRAQLRAATLVVGNDPDTFDWNTLTRLEEQEREIERLHEAGDKLAEYVDLLAHKGDDITTAELEGALNAFTQWHSLKGGEG